MVAIAALIASLLMVAGPVTPSQASSPTRSAPAPAAAAPAAASVAARPAVCTNFNHTVSMTANVQLEGALHTQYWPGGTLTIGTAPCTVTVKRPSGRIDLVGALGDPWEVSIPNGSQMQSAQITEVALPNCTIAGAGGSVVAQRPSCSLGVSFDQQTGSTAAMTLSATANPVLTVTKAGTGSGLVSSSPSGISCGATCEAQFAQGTTVTLTRTAASGSHFQSWGGACSGGGATCTVTMSQARNVTATFALDDVSTLSVSKGGSGLGTVTSTPAGINCGPTNSPSCQFSFANGTLVTLSVSPQVGSVFAGWGGACSGMSPTCNVTMNANRNVVANFLPVPTPTQLTVARSGDGAGRVVSDPAGIDCGSDCTATFDSGTTVTLTATPAAGSTFTGWSGGGCSGLGTCQVGLTAATTVTATFATAALDARPDGLIGLGSKKPVGDAIYNSTGARQTKQTTAKRTTTVAFAWTVQNDGAQPDEITWSQKATGKAGFTVTFKRGKKNVTGQVVSGKFRTAIRPGDSVTLTVVVKVKPGAKPKAARTWLLRATSGSDPSKLDVVGAKVTAKR